MKKYTKINQQKISKSTTNDIKYYFFSSWFEKTKKNRCKFHFCTTIWNSYFAANIFTEFLMEDEKQVQIFFDFWYNETENLFFLNFHFVMGRKDAFKIFFARFIPSLRTNTRLVHRIIHASNCVKYFITVFFRHSYYAIYTCGKIGIHTRMYECELWSMICAFSPLCS